MMQSIDFDGLVAFGIANGGNVVEGMPWSFTYEGAAVTHENNDCYIVCPRDTTRHLRLCRGDYLVKTDDGGLHVLQPHQLRVLEEFEQLADRLQKLDAFITKTPDHEPPPPNSFRTLWPGEQMRLMRQKDAMVAYASILAERITAWGL